MKNEPRLSRTSLRMGRSMADDGYAHDQAAEARLAEGKSRGVRFASASRQSLCRRMHGLVGFRNTAIHNYKKDLDILEAIVKKHLGDFRELSATLLKVGGKG